MADFSAPSADDMYSLVAELRAAGAQAQHAADAMARHAAAHRRTFDCVPPALALVVGHNGDRLREMERLTGCKIRATEDRHSPRGGVVMVEAPDEHSLGAASEMVEKSLELARSPQRVMVSRQTLGRVIGRNGERIKSVNDRSGARCVVQQLADPCFVQIESDDPIKLQVAREMILSFIESASVRTWQVEEQAMQKAQSNLANANAGFASLPSPLAPAHLSRAHAPVGGPPASEQAIDPYKHADLAWGSAADPEGRVYYYNSMTGQSTWDKPPGFPG